jgi:uncharacterized phosphosugar-binding protein
MTDYSEQFFSNAIDALQQVSLDSGAAIHQTAQALAEAIINENQLYLFGSGHSALVARDAAGRAGGLVPVTVLEDVIEGDAERLEGLARIIVGRYHLRSGSVFIVISNSGINPVPIEMAMLGKEVGLTVVAITSLQHSRSVESRHSSGKKLYELADIVIDTHIVRGDAVIEVSGSPTPTGATSTIVGCTIVQAITVQTVALLAENGHEPPVLVSANIPEGRDHNRELLTRYRPQLARYQFPLGWD